MADPESIIRIISAPGIKRDGTVLDGDNYVDGQWCRFQRAMPRKMGGFRSINKYLDDIPRFIHGYTQDSLTYVHAGSATKVERLYIESSFNSSIITDRTPTSGYTANTNNMWQFDTMFQSGGTNQIVAQVAPNLDCICSSTAGALFYGNLTGTAVLAPITLPVGGIANGGIVILHPYLFFFGSNGYVGWSIPGNPANLTGAGSGAANITGQKIVRGMPLRGGPGNSPSGLFWSADSLLRASFIGGTPIFQFDTISAQSSIMSSNSVIEYDGIFYWLGSDRFLMFNGVVREVDNQLNSNWFFDNINYSYRQKIFAFKVPRYGEIWWCYPRGSATEPSHAIIYNVRENIWYDTALPGQGRGAGLFPEIFRRPLMSGVEDGGDGYKLWVHEVGTDSIDGIDVQPIQSYFETGDISLPISSGVNKSIQALMLEPDFVQSGDMTVSIHGRANARSPEVNGTPITFPDTPSTPSEQVVHFKDSRRQLRFRFESNAVGGNYEFGHCLAHIRPGDGTSIG